MSSSSHSRPLRRAAGRRSGRARVLVVAGALVVGAGAAGLGAPLVAAEDASVPRADAALSSARTQRERTAAALSAAVDARRSAQARVDDLGRQDAQVAGELARVRRQVREYAVAAYIDGGRTEVFLSSLAPDDAGALAWRTGLVAGSTVSQGRAVDRYRALRRQAEPARVAAATDLDRARDAEDRARSAFLQASALERDAEAQLVRARAIERAAAERAAAERAAAERAAAERAQAQAAARQVAAVAPVAAPVRRAVPAPVTGGGGGIGDATPQELALLARIRRCESGGNYSIVSATGRYRGAYQFSVSTWQAMGGTGDPAAAPPAEQDLRALMLLRRQGPRAWPVCSR